MLHVEKFSFDGSQSECWNGTHAVENHLQTLYIRRVKPVNFVFRLGSYLQDN